MSQGSKPIRVLLMSSSMRGGGSERQTLLLLKHLDRSRFTPHLYLLERTGDFLDQVPRDVAIHSLQDTPPDDGFYFPGRALARQVRHLRNVLQQQQIDVVYDRTFHLSTIAGPAAKPIGVPRVSTIVSPPEHALPLIETRFVRLKRRRLAQAYRDSYQIVAVSQQAAQSARRYYRLGDASIQVIANPVDIAALQAASAATVPRENRYPLELVCVGRITAEKGHRDLIEALAHLDSWAATSDTSQDNQVPPIRLTMVGDGPLRKELQRHWQTHRSRHTIEFIGHQAEPASWMKAADALVLPSHFEGMPNVVLEAMALGTAVIATAAGGTVELERDEPTIFWAEPRSARSVASAIKAFVAHPERVSAHREAATRMLAEHHDVGKTVARIETLLSQAHAAAPQQAP